MTGHREDRGAADHLSKRTNDRADNNGGYQASAHKRRAILNKRAERWPRTSHAQFLTDRKFVVITLLDTKISFKRQFVMKRARLQRFLRASVRACAGDLKEHVLSDVRERK